MPRAQSKRKKDRILRVVPWVSAIAPPPCIGATTDHLFSETFVAPVLVLAKMGKNKNKKKNRGGGPPNSSPMASTVPSTPPMGTADANNTPTIVDVSPMAAPASQQKTRAKAVDLVRRSFLLQNVIVPRLILTWLTASLLLL